LRIERHVRLDEFLMNERKLRTTRSSTAEQSIATNHRVDVSTIVYIGRE
jgi:hypothetical protein